MKAIRLHAHGGPEVLRYEEVPPPRAKPNETLVRVRAVGLNPPDWYLRDGMTNVPPHLRPPFRLPAIPGTDMSGVVESGDGFAVGDEVFGMLRFPGFEGSTYAEVVTAPASDLARKPAAIDHVHAAAAPMSALTAWQFLIELGHDHPSPFQAARHRPVPLAGKTVLVNGAAGGVGHVAVQLAKWRGARVIAVASGAHDAFLRALGADDVIDYTRVEPAEVVRDVDLVLDTVGGAETGRFLRTLRDGGALFPVFPGPYDEAEAAARHLTVSGTQVRSSGAQLAVIGELLAAGTLRVAIDSTYPLAEAQRAHERAARGRIQGKLVLAV